MLSRENSRFNRIFKRTIMAFASSLLLITAGTLGAGCGGDDDDNPGSNSSGASEDGCSRAELEADLVGNDGAALAGQTKLAGPAVDPATGRLKPGNYVISSTYLRMPRSEAAQARFGELVGPIAGALMTQQGLVAFAFSQSEACATARTLTVWESEEAMYEFVSSPAHRAAASAGREVSRGGSAVTHWSGTEADAVWAKGAAELGKSPGVGY
jgi:heme-degrading monooxygenase HmoA